MKPEQFIREFGEKKAREVVEGAPDGTASHYVADTDTYYSEEFLTYFDHSLEDWETADLNNIGELETIYEHVVILSDLKSLVESLDHVAQRGGLSKTKDHLDYLISFGSEFAGVSKEEIKELQQDVAVHESIYGGGDE